LRTMRTDDPLPVLPGRGQTRAEIFNPSAERGFNLATFFMFGKYNAEAIETISISRTEQAMETVRQLGGEVNGMYALLGEYDLLFCIELPDVELAMKASVALTKLTGISFNSCPAIKVETFDRLTAK